VNHAVSHGRIFNRAKDFGVGVARMNYRRQFQIRREIQKPFEPISLLFLRRMIVKKVQADFAESDDFFSFRELCQFVQRIFCQRFYIMRVRPDRRIHMRIGFRDFHGSL
jgi:hypothetical protein